jgi:hypothetical protein
MREPRCRQVLWKAAIEPSSRRRMKIGHGPI